MTTRTPATPASGTAGHAAYRLVEGVRRWWPTLRPIERVCYLVAAVLLASGVVHLGVLLVTGSTWLGPVSFRKPMTFGVSFGLSLATVTWVASHLVLGDRARRLILGVFAADCVVEVLGITVQAWRHVPSHFNTETPGSTVIAMSLALGGAVLVLTLGALAVTAFRGRIDAAPDMRLAIRAGFAFLVLGLATGAAMIARGEVLINTGHLQAAYDTAGAFKGVHAVTLHAILVLPLVSARTAAVGWPENRRMPLVQIAIGAYALATLLTVALTVLL